MAYKDQFLRTQKNLRKRFGTNNTGLIFYHQPLYEFAFWTFQIAMKTKDTDGLTLKRFSQTQLDEEKVEQFVMKNGLKYYNYDIHLASMAYPTYVKKMLSEIEEC